MYKRFYKHKKAMLFKAPGASFLSNHMYENYPADIVLLVRHPVGFHESLSRLGWKSSFSDFLSQQSLIEGPLAEEREMMGQDLADHEKNALFWRCVFKVVHRFSSEEKTKGVWLQFRHEDICIDPESSFRSMFESLSLPFTSKVERRLQLLTEGRSRRKIRHKGAVNLNRDSQAIPFSWKHRVDPIIVNRIREITRGVSEHYYGDDEW